MARNITKREANKLGRIAKTRNGKVVELGRTIKVDGGWTSYELDRRGFAVAIFIPSK